MREEANNYKIFNNCTKTCGDTEQKDDLEKEGSEFKKIREVKNLHLKS